MCEGLNRLGLRCLGLGFGFGLGLGLEGLGRIPGLELYMTIGLE